MKRILIFGGVVVTGVLLLFLVYLRWRYVVASNEGFLKVPICRVCIFNYEISEKFLNGYKFDWFKRVEYRLSSTEVQKNYRLENNSVTVSGVNFLKNSSGLSVKIYLNKDYIKQSSGVLLESDTRELNKYLIGYLCLYDADGNDLGSFGGCFKKADNVMNKRGILLVSKLLGFKLVHEVQAVCNGFYQCGTNVTTCRCSSGGGVCTIQGSSCNSFMGTCNCSTDCSGDGSDRNCSGYLNQATCQGGGGACAQNECVNYFDCSWTSCPAFEACPSGCGYGGGNLPDGSCGTHWCPATAACCNSTNPNAPTLIAPADGAVINVGQLTNYSWNAIGNWGIACPNNNRYEVCISSNQSSCDLVNNVSTGLGTNYNWTPVAGDSLVTWNVRSNNGSNTATSATRSFCVEGVSCTPACGQARNCGAACANTDAGSPTAPILLTANGVDEANAVSYPPGTHITLSWQSTSNLTDFYAVGLYDSSNNVIFNPLNILGTSVTTPVFPAGVYHWRVRPINISCGTSESLNVSAWGYFRINAPPTFDNTIPGGNLVVTNRNWTVVPIENMVGLGRSGNQICATAFATTASPKAIKIGVTATDPDGGAQIDTVFVRFMGGPTNGVPLTVGVSGITTTPVNILQSSGGAVWDTGQVTIGAVAGNSRSVTFAVNLRNNFPTDVYSMDIKVTDIYGGDSGWIPSNRYFKVWNCQVELSGHAYESDPAVGGVCLTGVGFVNLASAAMNFSSVTVTRTDVIPPFPQYTVNSQSGNYYIQGVGATWGGRYVINTNGDINASGVVRRWGGVAGPICGNGNDINNAMVNPYTDIPSLVVDFSATTSQEPWFQVIGGGIFSRSSISGMIPTTCALSTGCTAAMTMGSMTMTNGLVAAPVISNDSGCPLTAGNCSYGSPNNWSYGHNIINDSYNYNYFYNNYFIKSGVGYTIPNDVTMTQIVNFTGGTGVVLVNGNVNIDINNTVALGRFLMIVASGTLTIDQSVTNTEGILVANNIVATGTNNTQLQINGMVDATGGNVSFSRGYTAMVDNNDSPATVVNYRPDLIFNLPVELSKVLTSWSQGK